MILCFVPNNGFKRERDFSLLVSSLFLLLNLFPSKHCYTIHYNITQSQPLLGGQALVSPSEIFELGFFSATNNSTDLYVGIWYKEITPRRVVWVANRENPLTTAQNSSANLRISGNGNLELVDGNGSFVYWSSGIEASSNSLVAVLLDNGNFVLKDNTSGINLWQSFYHPADTFLPGATLGFDVKNKEKYALNSWKVTWSNPSPGYLSVEIAPKQPPEVVIWFNKTIPVWRSGPWDQSKFVGIPAMDAIYQSPFSLVENEDAGTTFMNFNVYDTSSFSLLFVSSAGVMRYVTKEQGQNWSINWEAPHTQCDLYGFCGPFGACEVGASPLCECLKGFEPTSYEDWSKGNWTRGCVRRTGLVCEANSSTSASRGKRDGFRKLGNVKLPDFYEFVSTLDTDNVDNCRTWCLSNCSCIAFAFVEGIGCLVWSKGLVDIQKFPAGGEDLFLRLAHSELVDARKAMKVGVGAAIASTAVAVGGLVFTLNKRRAKQKDLIQKSKMLEATLHFSKPHDSPELTVFEFDTILVATDNFNISSKLGQGGFGSVYKGKLADGREIAVKRLSSSSGQGVEEFKNEIQLISRLQHRNLVKLYGCCVEKEEKLLIYEFLPNKSLDFFLFDPKRREQLNWETRFDIIRGVARGILYLHRDSCLRVIHRDLKVSNILLDEKMNPKISDFGLARMFHGTLDLVNTHRVVGTLGYMSPEYAMGGIFSEKSDVFSFGVLVLEIVSGTKNSNFYYHSQQQSLISYAWQLWSESRAEELADYSLSEPSRSSPEVMRSIHVGLLCIQDQAADRPTMADVVFMLRNEMDRPKPKQPVFAFQSSPTNCDNQSQGGSKCSGNVDITCLVEGR